MPPQFRGPPGGATPPQPPPFMGMAPSTGKAYMPSSYGYGTPLAAHPDSPDSDQSPFRDPDTPADQKREADLAAAISEWRNIRSALETLGSHLGPRYQAMDAAYMGLGSTHSPFGPAICFQKFDIAVLNALYHLCRIVLYRAHPEMPPASMVAAGVAAQFTIDAASKIGQIAAGIFALAGTTVDRANPKHPPTYPRPAEQKGLNPSIGGMFCEITMPLFFAGVQFQAPHQRAWLVDHLYDVEVRTGWATAGMIGHGCETAWKRTAEAGRGPPWERSGYWSKRDREVDSDPRSPTWAQGVRGFEAQEVRPHGLNPAGLIMRRESSARGRTMLQDERIVKAAEWDRQNRRGEELRKMGVAGDRGQEVHWAMGLMGEES